LDELEYGPFRDCIDGDRSDELAVAWQHVAREALDLWTWLAVVGRHMCRKLKLSRSEYEEKYLRNGYKLTVPGLPERSDAADEDQGEDAEADHNHLHGARGNPSQRSTLVPKSGTD
jgi:hypothetical protein